MIPLIIILSTALILNDPFAANELRPDEVFLVNQTGELGVSNYSQAIQLERGWNLVSWYLQPPHEGLTIEFDEIFLEDPGPPREYYWLNPEPPNAPPEAGDRVGKHDENPNLLLYPVQSQTWEWEWEMKKAYHVYLDTVYSSAHFWEYQGEEDYDQMAFSDLNPSNVWPRLQGADYWYFLAYPLRMQLMISSSNTIEDLVQNQDNPLQIIRSDDGRMYDPWNEAHTNLWYLEPGKGYFIGFDNSTVISCNGFSDEVAEPEAVPPNPKSDPKESASLNPSHFVFKSRTHWWYSLIRSISEKRLWKRAMRSAFLTVTCASELRFTSVNFRSSLPPGKTTSLHPRWWTVTSQKTP